MDTLELPPRHVTRPVARGPFSVTFPEAASGNLAQDAEWCWLSWNGCRQKIRFHDYDEIYAIPGLYEHLFYDKLRCTSPQVVVSLLEEQVMTAGQSFCELVVLDVGAGNGIVGQELAAKKAKRVIGLDIIPEAAEAANRDRPGVYDDYFVADLTKIHEATYAELQGAGLNCLTTVAALGFGDIPPLAFAQAFNLISTPGWIAFNLKSDFLAEADPTGFSGLIHHMVDADLLRIEMQHEYRHRFSVTGEPLHYVAVSGVKQDDVPLDWFGPRSR